MVYSFPNIFRTPIMCKCHSTYCIEANRTPTKSKLKKHKLRKMSSWLHPKLTSIEIAIYQEGIPELI